MDLDQQDSTDKTFRQVDGGPGEQWDHQRSRPSPIRGTEVVRQELESKEVPLKPLVPQGLTADMMISRDSPPGMTTDATLVETQRAKGEGENPRSHLVEDRQAEIHQMTIAAMTIQIPNPRTTAAGEGETIH